VRSILTVALLAAVSIAPGYAQKSGPYTMKDEGVQAPVVIREVKPKYTDAAKERRVQGSVELDVVVKSDGAVGDVTVTKSLDPELDEQAINATKQWRFRPGTKDSKPVDVLVQIELTFTLK
jgi:TonB family protein